MERYILKDAGDWLDRVGLFLLEVRSNISARELTGFLRPYGWTLEKLGVRDEETYLGMRKI